MKVTCSPKAMIMQMWKNDKCAGAAGSTQSIPFDTCLPDGPKGTYISVHHKQ